MKQTASTRLCTRRIIATAKAARDQVDPLAYAANRWPGDSPVVTRGAVGGSDATDWSVTADYELLFDAVLEQSVVGRAGLRRVPFNVRMLAPDDQLAAHWVAEGKAIPVSRMSLQGAALERRKVAAITLVTAQSLDAKSQRIETQLEANFRSKMALALNQAFLDSANSGSGSTPASVTNAAASVAGTGDPSADLAALIAVFPGDLSRAAFATDPTTAAQIALWRDSSGGAMFPDCGPAGGSLLGLPLLTSRGSPRDSSGGQLALIDGSGIALAAEGLEVLATESALVEMDDASPTGASDTPTAATATPVALFQVGCVAFRFTMHCNWQMQRPSVAVVTSASY